MFPTTFNQVGDLYFEFPALHDFEALRRLVPPLVEPVPLSLVKAQCRIDTTDEDDLVARYAKAARVFCENRLRKMMCAQTWRLTLKRWPRTNHIRIPIGPTSSVVQFVYTDSGNNVTALVNGTDFALDNEPDMAEVTLPFGIIWPTATLQTFSPIRLDFVAGYPTFSSKATVDASGNLAWSSGDQWTSGALGYTAYFSALNTIYPVAAFTDATHLVVGAGSAGTLPALNATPFPVSIITIPEGWVQAILMLVGHWYNNRETVVVGRTATISTEISFAVDALLDIDRIHRF